MSSIFGYYKTEDMPKVLDDGTFTSTSATIAVVEQALFEFIRNNNTLPGIAIKFFVVGDQLTGASTTTINIVYNDDETFSIDGYQNGAKFALSQTAVSLVLSGAVIALTGNPVTILGAVGVAGLTSLIFSGIENATEAWFDLDDPVNLRFYNSNDEHVSGVFYPDGLDGTPNEKENAVVYFITQSQGENLDGGRVVFEGTFFDDEYFIHNATDYLLKIVASSSAANLDEFLNINGGLNRDHHVFKGNENYLFFEDNDIRIDVPVIINGNQEIYTVNNVYEVYPGDELSDDNRVLGSGGTPDSYNLVIGVGTGLKLTLNGSNDDDIILGGSQADKISGGDGDDVIASGKGNDTIKLSEGNDIIDGGDDIDTFDASASSNNITIDLLNAKEAEIDVLGFNDVQKLYNIENINTGSGNDNITGNNVRNVINSGVGNDEVHGQAGDDLIDGQDGDDTLYGDGGEDILLGDKGNDKLYGGFQNDELLGGADNDELYGESGNDTLIGGEGNDHLEGGAELDTYIFRNNHGYDTIIDNDGKLIISGKIVDGIGFSTGVLSGNKTYFLPHAGKTLLLYKIGDDLLIETSNGNFIKIENFNNDTFGIELTDPTDDPSLEEEIENERPETGSELDNLGQDIEDHTNGFINPSNPSGESSTPMPQLPNDANNFYDGIGKAWKDFGNGSFSGSFGDFLDDLINDAAGVINEAISMIPALFDQGMNFTQTRRVDPLVFDLDGDGVELISLDESGVQFDLDNDNVAEATGWVSADDGMLAFDRNGNGTIDDITELFGNETTTGFVELQAFDSNGDNIIDANDSQFGELRMWRDLNQNGVSEANELETLDETGIAAIYLDATPASYAIENNLVIEEGSFSTTSGSTGSIAEVLFAVDQINSNFSGTAAGADDINIETLFLPQSRGYGNLPSWHVAMTLDPVLLQIMKDIVNISPENTTQAESLITDFLYRWAGVDGVDPASRGGVDDARKLEFLEEFTGTDFFSNSSGSNPLIGAWQFVNTAFNTVSETLGNRILSQGTFGELLDSSYDFATDEVTVDSSLTDIMDRASLDLSAIDDISTAKDYWVKFVKTVQVFNNNYTETDAEITKLIGDLLIDKLGLSASSLGNNEIDNLLSTTGTFIGTGNADALDGTQYGDFILGLDGNDSLRGSFGNHTFDGNDFIDGGAGDDSIGGHNGNDVIYGGAGDDSVDGGYGNDIIDGGLGDDVILGAGGDDTYIYHLGEGSDTFIDFKGSGDVIEIHGDITFDDITFSRGFSYYNELIMSFAGYSETITIEFQYRSVDDMIETLRIVNGTNVQNMDLTTLYLPLIGTEQDDYISGGEFADIINANGGDDHITANGGDDIINAGEGNDNVNGGAGDDIINGGAGDDELYGDRGDDIIKGEDGNDFISTAKINGHQNESGGNNIVEGGLGDDYIYIASENDTIIFNVGDGNDTIVKEYGNTTLVFGEGILLSDIETIRIGIDLLITFKNNFNDSITVRTHFYDSYDHRKITEIHFDDGTVIDGLNDPLFNPDYIGTEGDDILNGGSGDETIYGLGGNDNISGRQGDDILHDGLGNDILIGGYGDDIFVITPEEGAEDLVYDLEFDNPNEKIDLSAFETIFSIADLTMAQDGDNVNITITDNQNIQTLKINNVNISDLTSDNFIFNEVPPNTAPDSISADNLDIAENASGSVIGNLTVSDIDVGDSHTFSVDDSRFEVVNGQLKLVDGESLNYELENEVDINVTATDSGGLQVTETFYINVQNVTDQTLTGTDQDDTINGGDSEDLIKGREGNDKLYGGANDDTIYGHMGNDKLFGEGGHDYLYGGKGNDVLKGQQGHDTLFGQAGNDQLFGGEGNDILKGGSGNDKLLGQAGVDILYGGSDADTFIFKAIKDSSISKGVDTIMDFEDGIDLIDISALVVNNDITGFGDLTITNDGTKTTVSANGTDFLFELEGVHALDQTDFII
ncbi:MAG: M10 family metallopeptidase C-terminal domain-containing protein [Proteobacteria bacterium]|nr:M10 family metallopeptidase C-terminal domain-containing protein [Pseudomonadota bacterium]